MQRIWLAGVALVSLAVSGGLAAREKTRVFITDSNSWEIKGGLGVGDDGGGGSVGGGARPQRAEIIKTFRERCPNLTVTLDKDKADYIILLEHEGGKELIRRDNKVVIFDKEGDAIFSGSTRSLGNAVKDSCHAIQQDLSHR